MAVTNTLQRSVNFASLNVGQAPLSSVGGFVNEPALTIGDYVRQFILGPPFAWRWNRATTTINAVAGTQDYPVSLSDFGWLEKSTVVDPNLNTYELEVVLNLSEESVKNLPTRICARLDNDAGTITFRISPPPDQSYTVNITYQKAAPLFAALTDTWSPIPDYLSYLYNQGFLAKAYEYRDSEKAVFATQMFVRQVIAANSGLKESEKNIFLADRINTLRQQDNELGGNQNARQGRGLYA